MVYSGVDLKKYFFITCLCSEKYVVLIGLLSRNSMVSLAGNIGLVSLGRVKKCCHVRHFGTVVVKRICQVVANNQKKAIE